MGGIPPIPLAFTAPMQKILLRSPYLPPVTAGLSPEEALLKMDGEWLFPLWPFTSCDSLQFAQLSDGSTDDSKFTSFLADFQIALNNWGIVS